MDTSGQALPPKQLSMSVTAETVRQLPDVALPEGYALRGYRSGDEDSWVALLNLGDFDTRWDRQRLDAYLADAERREGSRVVAMGREIVAATFASRENKAGLLDYVVTHPNHRDRRLGQAVCTAVLKFFAERGYEKVILTTDDWRLPDIKVYLSLGFIPEMTREDMPSRWENVMNRLGKRGV